jgi:uncharacterized protein (DUF1501 family)
MSRPRRHLVARRQTLTAGSLGLMNLTLPGLLAGRSAAANVGGATTRSGRAKSCILLFMWGGPAHQDTWDLKPDAPLDVRGQFQPIDTNVSGIQICEHFPQLARRMDQLCVIRSMTHGTVDHTTATHHLLTGQPPLPFNDFRRDWPHIGSVLARTGRGRDPLPAFVSMRPELPGDVPRFVEESHGQFAGWLGPAFDPLTIDADPAREDYRVGDVEPLDGVPDQRMGDRKSLLNALESTAIGLSDRDARRQMDRHYARAFDLLASAVGRSAFDLTEEPEEIRERYGRNPHGQSVLQARRLVERGVPLVTVFWPNDGIKNVSVYWDTHSRNFVDLKDRLMPVADRAFSALLDDLRERGMLDETLVVWTGEFGRTPKVGQRNSDAGAGADGRDHWPNCFTSVLAGGGVAGGQVYGASDRYAAYPSVNPTSPLDLTATIYELLGVPPQLELHDLEGRPHVICPGTPVQALMS